MLRSRLLTFIVGTVTLLIGSVPREASAGCNIIPPAERSYPSSLGSVVSPIAVPGRTVEIRLGPCDGATGFDPSAASNTATLTFEPPAGPPTAVPIPVGTVSNCTGGNCGVLTFVMPSTTGVLPPDGLAGPARITVVRGVTTVADIGPLYAPRPSATACTDEAEDVFEHFTVLPAPNDFDDMATGTATQVLGTLDGGGNLIIPFDYVAVLPLGPGEPVARLVSAFATLDAFTSNPGVPITVPDTSFARSFTVDGRPLPPLLRTTAAGDAIFGTTDAAQAILRIARTDGQGGPPIFDLSDRFSNGGRGPIVITAFSAESRDAVPLANLHSSTTGVAYTRDETLEGNLNAGSGDTDTDDRVVQILDAVTGMSTNTGMAAADPHSPIYGPAAVDTTGQTVAFLESERDQNATDLNGDGDARDAVLRVFDLTGSEVTPDGTLAADPFTVINRRPLATSGSLVFYREPQPGLSKVRLNIGNVGFGGDGSIVTTPDGRFVFTTSGDGATSALLPGYRDPETGDFRNTDYLPDGLLPGIGGASGMAVSPDSRFLYIAGSTDNAVQAARLSLELFSGVLPTDFADVAPKVTAVEVETDGAAGVDGLAGVTRLAISADGKHLYASGTGEDAVSVFARDLDTGTLGFVEAEFDGAGGVSGLDEPRGIAVSPDGDHVYVAAHASSAVTAFARNQTTGALTFVATYGDGGLGGPSLGGVREVAVSADGLNVYAAADTDSAVSVFSRNLGTGALTFVEAKVQGIGGVDGISQARALAVAPDDSTVYAGGDTSSLAVFQRTMPGGTLVFVEAETNDHDVTLALAVSPDSQDVYAFVQSAMLDLPTYVVPWQRNGRLRAFDTSTGMLRPGLGAEPASLAAVAAGRAVFLSPEGDAGGTDQNGDTDETDLFAYAYDAATDSVTPLTGVSDFVADRIALSSTLLALRLPEDQQQLGSQDLNGNGVTDAALAVVPTSSLGSAPQIVPVSVGTQLGMTDLCAGGANANTYCQADGDCPGGACKGVVVFLIPELTTNRIDLGLYHAATGEVTHIPQAALDFVVSKDLIAFRSPELVGSQHLNGDPDTTDYVLFVYDLRTNRLINSGQAVVRCELPGCTPGQPYKIVGESVAFLTNEADQGGTDLDGDGSATGTVAQIFNVRSAHRKIFRVPAGAPNLPPLPDDLIGQTVVYEERYESELGVDVNMDGDLDDVVNLITGDNDGDGVFNDDDTCVEIADDDGRDSDLDGLGDVCDPNPYCTALTLASPPLAPLANEPCQKAIGKAVRGYLSARANVIRGCLGDIAKGKIPGPAAITCRGSSFGGQEVLPADPKTLTKLAKARAKLDKTIGKSCTPTDLGALDPCATDVAGLATCLADRITAGAEALLTLAYGDVGTITDKATLGCQKAIGGAAVGYVKSAVGAIVGCLDKRNKGDFVGDGQALCLGASTPAGITLPTEPGTGTKLDKAEAKARKALATKCSGALLTNLNACGVTPDAVGDCLVCTGWRRVVEAVRGGYGVP